MKGAIYDLGELLIRADRKKNIRGLNRNLELVKIIVLQNPGMVECRFNQGLWTGFGIFFEQMAFQRPGINANAHRASMIARGLDHLANTFRLANIAGIDPQAGSARLGRLNGTSIMKMNVGDNGYGAVLTNYPQRRRTFLVRAGYPHDVGTCLGGGINLRNRCLNIGGECVGHGLD